MVREGEVSCAARLASSCGQSAADHSRRSWQQRIAIARVFLKNPPILILDAATSSLDTFAEAAVQDALGRLSRGRTTIIIAHRLTTIRHATMICYLEKGRIVESGTHDDLVAKDGRYRALLAVANGNLTEA